MDENSIIRNKLIISFNTGKLFLAIRWKDHDDDSMKHSVFENEKKDWITNDENERNWKISQTKHD